MPLFVTRLPGLEAYLVRAGSIEHVYRILDETVDPGACRIEEYHGPVALRLRPRFDVSRGASGQLCFDFVDDPQRTHVMDLFDLEPVEETGADMLDELDRVAFPALHKVLVQAREEAEEATLADYRRVIERALSDDLRSMEDFNVPAANGPEGAAAEIFQRLSISVSPAALAAGVEQHRAWIQSGWGPLPPRGLGRALELAQSGLDAIESGRPEGAHDSLAQLAKLLREMGVREA